MTTPAKNTICLWYDGDAEDAAKFYAQTFPNSRVGRVQQAPGDYPDGKQGDALVVEFTVLGIDCIGLNGGPQFKPDAPGSARGSRARGDADRRGPGRPIG